MRMNTDIISRLLIASLLMYAPFTWFSTSDSVASQMGMIQPDHGVPLVLMMVSLSLAIYADVIINSVFDCRFKWEWAKRHRDTFYMAGAFCAVTVLFSVAKYVELTSGATYLYLILFVACAAHGLVDSYAKRPCIHPLIERRKTRRDTY